MAAWAIGAIGRRSSLAPLRAAYAAEAEPNARANIAWALVRCSSWRPSRRDIETLLDDPYHPVVLIALKALGSLSDRVRRDPVRLYADHHDVLLRQALLDEIHRFSVSARDLKRFLLREVGGETRPWLRAALLRALSKVDPTKAAGLARSLSESATTNLERRFLRSAFVVAVTSSGESRWCPELSALYGEIDDPERRWDIITATAGPGGPSGLRALLEMETSEDDDGLGSALRSLIEALLITRAVDIDWPLPLASLEA